MSRRKGNGPFVSGSPHRMIPGNKGEYPIHPISSAMALFRNRPENANESRHFDCRGRPPAGRHFSSGNAQYLRADGKRRGLPSRPDRSAGHDPPRAFQHLHRRPAVPARRMDQHRSSNARPGLSGADGTNSFSRRNVCGVFQLGTTTESLVSRRGGNGPLPEHGFGRRP